MFKYLSDRRLGKTVLLCGAILTLHYALGIYSTLDKCTTFDETLHVTAGYAYNTFGDFRLQPENGVLPQRWMALPLAMTQVKFPSFETGEWVASSAPDVGHEFFYHSGNAPDRLLLACRAANGIWSVATGVLLFVVMRRVTGAASAWWGLVLFALNPAFLAHGFLGTSDACVAFFFLLAVISLWRVLHRLCWFNLSLTSIALAGLFVAKFSAPLVLPMGFLLGGLRLIGGVPWQVNLNRPSEIRSRWLQFVVMGGLAIVLGITTWIGIWAAYDFRYSAYNASQCGQGAWMESWDQSLATPSVAGKIIGIARDVKLFPEAYLYGALYVQRHSSARNAFFWGEQSQTGWWMFFPYAAFAKTPTGNLLLVVLAVGGWCQRFRLTSKDRRIGQARQLLYLFAPIGSLVAVYWAMALVSHLNIGHRHLLPVEAPMLMFASTVLVPWCVCIEGSSLVEMNDGGHKLSKSKPKQTASVHEWRSRVWSIAVAGCMMLSATESFLAKPNYLAFFNYVSGGPSVAWKRLVDSSLDWGQDLPSLKRWLDQERQQAGTDVPAYLSYFGTGDPAYYKVAAKLLPCHFDRRETSIPEPLQPGIFCFGATMFQGVYSPYPGPWSPAYESDYRRLSAEIERLRIEVARRGVEAVWGELPAEQKATWMGAFEAYEQLRLTRLTEVLRLRRPDHLIQYSILIYRVDARELATATGEP